LQGVTSLDELKFIRKWFLCEKKLDEMLIF